ncbi:MAG: hypothetical protein ACREOK_06845 [Gemmatimonadaceae bacterium]
MSGNSQRDKSGRRGAGELSVAAIGVHDEELVRAADVVAEGIFEPSGDQAAS